MAEGENIAGSARIDITVDAGQVEAALKAAVETALKAISAEIPVGFTQPTGTPTPAPATGAAAAAAAKTGTTQGVDAKVNATLAPDAIQKSLDGHTFTLKINTGNIREQIQSALNEPFNLTVNVHGLPQGQQLVSSLQTGGAPSATVQSGGTPTLAAAMPEFSRSVEAAFKRSITGVSGAGEQLHLLYTNLNNALQAAGQTGLRHAGTPGGTNEFAKFSELVDRLGPMSEWFKQVPGKPGQVSSGPAFDILRSLGVDEAAIRGANASVRSPARTLFMEGASSQGGGASLRDISQTIANEIMSGGRVQAANQPQQVAEAVRAAVPAAVAAVQHEAARVAAPAAEAPTPRAADPQRPPAPQATVLARSTLDEFVSGIKAAVGPQPKPVVPGTRPMEGGVTATREIDVEKVAALEAEKTKLQGRIGATLRKFNAFRIPEGMDAESVRAGMAGQGNLENVHPESFTAPGFKYAPPSALEGMFGAVKRIREIENLLARAVSTVSDENDPESVLVRRPPDPDDVERPQGVDPGRVRRRGVRRRQGGEVSSEPSERVRVGATGEVERVPDLPSALPFDVDPNTGKRLSGSQLIARNQGRLPSPSNPETGFNYAPLILAAQRGTFSNAGTMVDELGKSTGEMIRYKPEEAGTKANPGDPEVAKLIGGREIAAFGGGRARGITPAGAALIAARGSLGTKEPLIPASEFEVPPGGTEDDSMAMRVINKLINPAAAEFEKQPVPAKPGMFNQAPDMPDGNRTRRMSDYIQADRAYAAAYKRLEDVQSKINVGRFSKTDVGLGERFLGGERGEVVLPSGERRDIGGSPDLLNLLGEQAKLRDQMDDLVNKRGANPDVARFAGLPLDEQRQAIRASRASGPVQSAASREGVEGRVGVPETTLEAERRAKNIQEQNDRVAKVAQGELIHLEERIRTGTLLPSAAELPPGYETLRTRPGEKPHTEPSTGEFIAQHVTAILDRFREEVGITTGRGQARAPQEFSDVLQPYVSAAFDLSRDPTTGRASVKGGGAMGRYKSDISGREGAVRGISIPEQDINAAEARSFAEKKYKDAIVTDLDRQQVQARRRVNATAVNEEGTFAETQDQQLVAARTRIQELRSQEATRMERGYYSGTRSTRRGSSLVTRPEFVRSGTSFEQFKADQGETPEAAEIAEIEGRMTSLREEAKAEVSRIDRARIAAIDLARRSTGQIHTASDVNYSNMNRNRQARSSRALATSEGYRRYTPPTATGEEGAERLAGLSEEHLIRMLGPKVMAEELPAGVYGPGQPEQPFSVEEANEIRADAIQRIQRTDPRVGMTQADIRRRAAGEAGANRQAGGITGDEVRDQAARTRRFLPGITAGGADPEAVGAALIAGGAGGTGGGRGRGTAVGGPGGFDMGRGPVHVIVDNTPLQVSFDGASVAGGGGAPTLGEQAVNRRRAQSAEFGAFTSQAGLAQAQRHIDRLRGQGFTDTQIASALKTQGLGSQASLLLSDTSAVSSNVNALRRRLNLPQVLSSVASPEREAADQRRSELSAEANAANRRILSRGFQASVTDLLQAPFFEGQRQAVARFTRESGQYATTLEKVADATFNVGIAQETHNKAIEGGKKNLIDASKAELQRAQVVEAARKQEAEDQRGIVDKARGGLPGTGAALGNLAVGSVAGGLAVGLGSIVFQLASQGLAVAEKLVGEALGNIIDNLTGFAHTASQVSTQLGQATRAAGGDAPGVVAQLLGTAGAPPALAAATRANLTRRAEIEAGNAALLEQAQLQRASQNFGTGDAGLFQPGGGIPGLTRSTGGILGSALFSNAPTIENLTKLLPRSEEFRFQGLNSTPESRRATILQNDQDISQFNTVIKGWNESLTAADSSLRIFTDATDEQVKQTRALLEATGADPSIVTFWTDLRIGVRQASGAGLTPSQFGTQAAAKATGAELLTDLGTQAGKPSSEELLTSLRRPLGIQLGVLDAQTELQQRSNSAQFALSNIAAPQRSFERALFPGGETGAAVPDAVLQTYAQLGDVASDAFDEIKSGVTAGRAELERFGLTDQDIQRVQDLGTAISDLQSGPDSGASQQLAANYADFAHSLEIGKRTLGDIVGLNDLASTQVRGVGEIQATNLGIQERIVLEKSRELTLLGQELSQRQINFRVAISGFQSVGLTPEERAARQDQAKYEASIAQRQLNLQKGITGAQIKIVDEQNLRALDDSVYNLEKLQRDFGIQVRVQGEAVLIEALSRVRDKVITDANTTIGKFRAVEELAISTAATIAQQTDEAYSSLLQKSRRTISQIRREYEAALGVAPAGVEGGTDESHRPGGSLYGDNQDTGGPGKPSNFNGGTGQVNISFSNISVRSQDDIEEIARKVEQTLDRKASLQGLRAPVGS